MLSMLQQMLSEDREESVRVAVVRSAALIAALSPDCDKYAQVKLLILIINLPQKFQLRSSFCILFL